MQYQLLFQNDSVRAKVFIILEKYFKYDKVIDLYGVFREYTIHDLKDIQFFTKNQNGKLVYLDDGKLAGGDFCDKIIFTDIDVTLFARCLGSDIFNLNIYLQNDCILILEKRIPFLLSLDDIYLKYFKQVLSKNFKYTSFEDNVFYIKEMVNMDLLIDRIGLDKAEEYGVNHEILFYTDNDAFFEMVLANYFKIKSYPEIKSIDIKKNTWYYYKINCNYKKIIGKYKI
jgi:hypothetical protein